MEYKQLANGATLIRVNNMLHCLNWINEDCRTVKITSRESNSYTWCASAIEQINLQGHSIQQYQKGQCKNISWTGPVKKKKKKNQLLNILKHIKLNFS